MTGHELVETVQKMKKEGFSFQDIADKFEITKPTARRIYLTGKIPDCAKKNLDPSPKLKATQERREKLNTIAKEWGFENWSNYETFMINERDRQAGFWRPNNDLS